MLEVTAFYVKFGSGLLSEAYWFGGVSPRGMGDYLLLGES